MARDPGEAGRKSVERSLGERATEEEREWRGSTPTEDVMERALEVEPGVEQHTGEDPGTAADPERTGPPPAHDPDRGEPE